MIFVYVCIFCGWNDFEIECLKYSCLYFCLKMPHLVWLLRRLRHFDHLHQLSDLYTYAKTYSHVIGSYPQPVTFQEGPHMVFLWGLWQGQSSKLANGCLKKRGFDPKLPWFAWKHGEDDVCDTFPCPERLYMDCANFPQSSTFYLLSVFDRIPIVFLYILHVPPLPALSLTKQPWHYLTRNGS